jgi:succinate-semialdehyde dehydrogenase/glutarate-semialdehyde dehydrogenase
MKIINPSTEQVIGDFPPDSPSKVEDKVRLAAAAYDPWRRLGVEERCTKLRAVAGALRRRRSEFARVMAQEVGKPITAGESEINKCAVACEHFAQNAAKLLEPTQLASGGGRGYCRFDPLGPMLAIVPWNYPFWQVFRVAAAALAAGNTMILKHAPIVPGSAAALEDVFQEAGFPEGVFVSVRIDDNAAAQQLCAHPLIRAVTVTGSERTGAAVGATAGGAIKKMSLELGGSDPFIVLRDADVEFAAASAAEARCVNSGQSCIAAKRFIVEEPVRARFEDAFVAAMNKRKFGDPMDPATQYGPLARKGLIETLQKQVDDSVQAGARLLCGGQRRSGVGYFYEPTVLADVRPGMPAFDEETFGPAAAVIGAADVAEAVQLANQSRFGLGASIWTRDLTNAEKIAADIDAGNVFINAVVRSDPRLPFGGVKNSGFGRELAEQGVKEFVNIKTVWVSKP